MFGWLKKKSKKREEELQLLGQHSGDEEPELNEIVASKCKILYQDGYAGWSCKSGWYNLLADLSYKIEALHLQLYPKYRVRAEISELKEKYGTLRLEIHATVDPSKFKCFLMRLCKKIAQLLQSKVSFGFMNVLDVPRHVEHVERELSKVEYIQQKRSVGNCANAAVFERDGKYYYVADYDKYQQSHDAPTKHLLLYKLRKLCEQYSREYAWKTEPTRKQEIVLNGMNAMLKKWTEEAEEEAHSTCEMCGSHIGSDWSPRCETRGWVSYICKRCAEKSGSEYYMDGQLWLEDKCIKTKKQLDEESKQCEAKEAEMMKQYDAEEEAFQQELADAKAEEAQQ